MDFWHGVCAGKQREEDKTLRHAALSSLNCIQMSRISFLNSQQNAVVVKRQNVSSYCVAFFKES